MSEIQPRTKFRIGLTGGIGSGKSTVSTMFQELGVTIIDSDVISHRLTQAGGAGIAAIQAAFGPEYIDSSGALDRPRMRRLVFSDMPAKKRLEGILHPLIRTQMLTEAQQTQGHESSPYQILVIPLLLEADSYSELVQRVLVIDCAESIQVARSMQRSGLQEEEVHAIMAQQTSRAERLRKADDILRNDGDLDSLRTQVHAQHRSYLALEQ